MTTKTCTPRAEPPRGPKTSPKHVFINCPFDVEFDDKFKAMIFAVIACGFKVRCAREMEDAGEMRLEKLYAMIEQARYGIHDISRVELDPVNRLPRFNMPLELGFWMAARRFGGEAQKDKRTLVFDSEAHRYQKFVSDLAGIDPKAHGGDPREIVLGVRNWLRTVSGRSSLPPPVSIVESYDRFVVALPDLAASQGFDAGRIIFADFERLAIEWAQQDLASARS